MLCEHVREHLSAYADRELSAELSAAIRAHLASCPACKALLADLRATADLVGRLPARPAPERLAEDILREIERRVLLPASEASVHEPQPQERSIALRRASPWPRALALAASILLVVGIGILAYVGSDNEPAVAPAVHRLGETEHAPASTELAAAKPSAPALAGRKEGPPLVAKRAADAAGTWEGEVGKKLAAVPEVAPAEAPSRTAKGERGRGEGRDLAARGPIALGLQANMAILNKAEVQVQETMNRVAQNEAKVEELAYVANTDNLRQVQNTLVIEADAPDEANRDLEQLFGANDWQPVAEAQAQAAPQWLGREGAGAAAEQKVASAQAAPVFRGYYFRAHADGETTWVVVADWDDVSRFSSQLANVDRLTVSEASSPPFRAIRALQRQVRSQVASDRPITRAEEEKRGTDAVEGETLG
ncbi:MAG: anti-sigma factor, partial [Phycisphaerae bacterium]